LYDPVLKDRPELLSDVWIGSLSVMIDTLIGYIGQYGFKLPNLTQEQINQIQFPINGQLIYNTTVDAPQFYQISSSSWRTITFT
jgi:hypothetical protein